MSEELKGTNEVVAVTSEQDSKVYNQVDVDSIAEKVRVTETTKRNELLDEINRLKNEVSSIKSEQNEETSKAIAGLNSRLDKALSTNEDLVARDKFFTTLINGKVNINTAKAISNSIDTSKIDGFDITTLTATTQTGVTSTNANKVEPLNMFEQALKII